MDATDVMYEELMALAGNDFADYAPLPDDFECD